MDKISCLGNVDVPLEIVGQDFKRIRNAFSNRQAEISEAESRLEKVTLSGIKKTIANNPLFFKRFLFESFECIKQ